MIKVIAYNENEQFEIHNEFNKILNGSITQGINEIDSFSFTILPSNPAYDKIVSRNTMIKCFNDKSNKVEFDGRVLTVSEKMDESGSVSKSVVCESCLGYLQDSVQPFADEKVYTLTNFIDTVLANHNTEVEEYKKIYRGYVNVSTDSDNTVYKALHYDCTYNIFSEKLVGVFGGEINLRREDDGKLYLDYLQKIGKQCETTIELSKNMKSVDRDISPIDIISRVIPLGAKLKNEITDESGNVNTVETEERLSITGYKDGNRYIEDSEKKALCSIVEATVVFDDVTTQATLYQRGLEFLEKNNQIQSKHSMSALDLSEIGLDFESFNVGDYYKCVNKLINLDDYLRITKKTINIDEPFKSSLTIGNQTTMTSISVSIDNKINSVTDSLQKEMYDNAQFILGNKGGYFVVEKDGITGFPCQVLMMDKPDKSKAKNVWLFNQRGLVHFSDYQNSVANIVMTMDGVINADCIRAGTLQGVKIIANDITITGGNVNIRTSGDNIYMILESDISSMWLYPFGLRVKAKTRNLSVEHSGYGVQIYDESTFDVDKSYIAGLTYYGLEFNNKIVLRKYNNEIAFGTQELNNRMYGTWFSSEGTVVTSDERSKNSFKEIDNRFVDFFDNLLPCGFRYNNGTSGRFHVGFKAQDVLVALQKAGLTTKEFAGYVDDSINNEKGLLGLRYEEFIGIIFAKVKSLEKEIIEIRGNWNETDSNN